MTRSISIRLDLTRKSVTVILLVFSILALKGGYYWETGFSVGDYTFQNLTIGHLLNETGFAGLVGIILMWTFEQLSANEFRELAKKEREDITRDVFHYVYGYGIPKQITDLIDQQILRTFFIRQNMLAQYKLEIIGFADSKLKYVRVKRTFTYEVQNLTDEPQPFPFSAATDKAPIAELDSEVRFLSLRVEGSSDPINYGAEALRVMERSKGQEKYLSLNGQAIVVLPGPDHLTTITVKSQTVRHLQGGCLYLILFNHTCDLELKVFVPNNDLEVDATAYDRINVLQKTAAHDPESGIYDWKIVTPILAYQGVYLSWNPKDSNVEEAANKRTGTETLESTSSLKADLQVKAAS